MAFQPRQTQGGGQSARSNSRGPQSTAILIAVLVVVVLVTALTVGGCPRSSPQEKVVAELSKLAAGAPAAKPSSAVAGYQVVVDCSQSMRGYAAVSGSYYHQVIDKLMTGLAATKVIRFGTQGGSVVFEEVSDSHLLHTPAFYSLTSNPDYEFYARAKSDGAGTVFLYVTDGVQSAPGAANLGPTVSALNELFGAGSAVAVLGYRSEFSGPLWSEEAGRWLPEARVEARPFYVIVVAPDQAAISKFVDEYLAMLKPNLDLRFDPAGVTLQTSQPTGQASTNLQTGKGWTYLEPDEAACKQVVERSQGGRFVDVLNGAWGLGSGDAAVKLCAVPELVGWKRWDGHILVENSAQRPVFKSANPGEGVRACYAANTIGGDHAVALLKLTPRIVAISDSVSRWSTVSDSDVSNAERTYRLGWMVEEMAKAQIAQSHFKYYVGFVLARK